MSPVRVQRKRTKGWRMPENTVSVCRPGRWGNPYKVGERMWTPQGFTASASREDVVAAFAEDLEIGACDVPDWSEVQAELAGKNLACWCPLDQPCHADVLLKIANGVNP